MGLESTHGSEGLPLYCEKFPQIAEVSETLKTFELPRPAINPECYKSFHNQELAWKVTSNYLKIEYARNEKNIKNFKEKLATKAVQSILSKRTQYWSIYKDIGVKKGRRRTSSENADLSLKRCGVKNKNFSQGLLKKIIDTSNEELNSIAKTTSPQQRKRDREKLLKESLFNSLLNRAFFNKQEAIEKVDNEKLEQLSNIDIFKCMARVKRELIVDIRRKAPKEQGGTSDTSDADIVAKHKAELNARVDSECSLGLENKNKRLKSHQEASKRKIENYKRAMIPLYKRVKSFPLLFKKVDNLNLFVDSTSKVRPSALAGHLVKSNRAKELIEGFEKVIKAYPDDYQEILEGVHDPKMRRKSKDLLKNNRDIDFAKLVNIYAKEVRRVSSNDGQVDGLMKRGIQGLTTDLTKSAATVCKGLGEGLHQFPLLVDEVMKLGSHENENMQSAYCQALRKDIIEKSKWSMRRVVGMGLIVLGTAAQVVPVLGTVSGVASSVAGSAIIAADSIGSAIKESDLLSSTEGLLKSGHVEDYQTVLDQSVEAKNKTARAVIDVVSVLALDIGGAVSSTLKSAKEAKALKVTTPKKVDVTGKKISFNQGGGATNGVIKKIENGYVYVEATNGPLKGKVIPVQTLNIGKPLEIENLNLGDLVGVSGIWNDRNVTLKLRSIKGRYGEVVAENGGRRMVLLSELKKIDSDNTQWEHSIGSTLFVPTKIKTKAYAKALGDEQDFKSISEVTNHLQGLTGQQYEQAIETLFHSGSKKNSIVVSDLHLGQRGSQENFDRFLRYLEKEQDAFQNGRVIVGGDIYDSSQMTKWLQAICKNGAKSISQCSKAHFNQVEEVANKANGDVIAKILAKGELRNDQLILQLGNHDAYRYTKVGDKVIYDPQFLERRIAYLEKRFPGIQILKDPDGSEVVRFGDGLSAEISHLPQPPPNIDLPIVFKNEKAFSPATGVHAGSVIDSDVNLRISGDNHLHDLWYGGRDKASSFVSSGNLGGRGAQYVDDSTGEVKNSGLFTVLLEDGRPVTIGPCRNGDSCIYTTRAYRAKDLQTNGVSSKGRAKSKPQSSSVATSAEGLLKQIDELDRDSKNKIYRLLETSPSLRKAQGKLSSQGSLISPVDVEIARRIIDEIPSYRSLSSAKKNELVNILLKECR